jgi:hypothetical protein
LCDAAFGVDQAQPPVNVALLLAKGLLAMLLLT